jgi:hypothetical protein
MFCYFFRHPASFQPADLLPLLPCSLSREKLPKIPLVELANTLAANPSFASYLCYIFERHAIVRKVIEKLVEAERNLSPSIASHAFFKTSACASNATII